VLDNLKLAGPDRRAAGIASGIATAGRLRAGRMQARQAFAGIVALGRTEVDSLLAAG